MVIPESYVKDRPVGEVRPQYNVLVQKLFSKPEIKNQFNELLLETATKLFNEKGMFSRVSYFQEFLKHHMYWDLLQTANLPTQHFNGTDSEKVYTIPLIENGYNGIGPTCNGDANGLYEYITIRSQTVLTSLGGTAQEINVDTMSEDDLVGLPITKMDDSDDTNYSSLSSGAIQNYEYLSLSTIISIFIILIFL